jgi:hypothetical protein
MNHARELSQVTAVIVTRGDCDLTPVLETLKGFGEVITWDNSQKPIDMMVYGRYLAAIDASNDIIYTQDDDCTTDPVQIVGEHFYRARARNEVWCNMPLEYRPGYAGTGISLVGFGSIFHRSMIDRAFNRYCQHGYKIDELFLRECDRVFTALNHVHQIDIPRTHLPHATAPDRMHKEPRHGDDLKAIRRRIDSITSSTSPWREIGKQYEVTA